MNGYHALHEPFTEAGELADGWSRDDPRLGEHYEHRRDWMAAHPLPVEEVGGGTYEESDIVLTVPSVASIHGDWCKPKSVKLPGPDVSPEAAEALVGFCRKYGVPTNGEPGWWLVVFYG